MDRIMLKSKAKAMIKGKIGILFVIGLIIFVISWIANLILGLIPGIGSLVYAVLIAPAFALSMTKVYLNVAADVTPTAGDAFEGFYDFWCAFKVQFLVGLFTFLWSLLFIVPGIVKAYSYSMSMYILAENKGMPALECIRRSKEMTDGYKMDLFVLELSFIGWILLVGVTFGIAGIWVIPYMETTFVNFYNAIKPITTAGTVVEEPAPEVIEAPVAEEAPEGASEPEIKEESDPEGPEVE